MNDGNLGETALVTGASAGLGREFARLFAADGTDLVVVARREQRLRALADELQTDHDIDVDVVPTDLSEPDAAQRLHERVRDRGHTVDVLVNNAGLGAYGKLHETDLDRELAQLRVNVEAPLYLAKLFLPAMVERDRGTVLNVSSLSAFTPGPNLAGYYASKAHVLSWTEAIAEELSDTQVTATALCPGPTETEFHEAADMTDSVIGSAYTMDAETVARAGYEAARDGETVVIPGLANKALYLFSRLGPRAVRRKVAGWLNAER